MVRQQFLPTPPSLARVEGRYSCRAASLTLTFSQSSLPFAVSSWVPLPGIVLYLRKRSKALRRTTYARSTSAQPSHSTDAFRPAGPPHRPSHLPLPFLPRPPPCRLLAPPTTPAPLRHLHSSNPFFVVNQGLDQHLSRRCGPLGLRWEYKAEKGVGSRTAGTLGRSARGRRGRGCDGCAERGKGGEEEEVVPGGSGSAEGCVEERWERRDCVRLLLLFFVPSFSTSLLTRLLPTSAKILLARSPSHLHALIVEYRKSTSGALSLSKAIKQSVPAGTLQKLFLHAAENAKNVGGMAGREGFGNGVWRDAKALERAMDGEKGGRRDELIWRCVPSLPSFDEELTALADAVSFVFTGLDLASSPSSKPTSRSTASPSSTASTPPFLPAPSPISASRSSRPPRLPNLSLIHI